MATTLRWAFLEYQVAGRSQFVKNRALRQFMKPLLNLQGEERILDVGCGFGAFGKLIQPLLGPKATLIGIDIDPIQVAYGNQHWARRPNMRLEVGDAAHINYPDGSFDLVSAMGLLEFVDATAVLPEMQRVLRRPGKLVVMQVDSAHYEQCPQDTFFKQFWEAYLEGMRQLGIDLELATFQAYSKRAGWVLEEFTLNIEYRVRITNEFLAMVEIARWTQLQNERYMRQLFEFNYQFVKHVGWSADQLWDFLNRQYTPETYLRFLRAHLGEDFYQKTPLRMYRVLF